MVISRRNIPKSVKDEVLNRSRCLCSICGARNYVELHHINLIHEGGTNDVDNLMVVCPTCHTMIHRAAIPSAILAQVMEDWVKKGVLGKNTILRHCETMKDEVRSRVSVYLKQDIELEELENWAQALRDYRQFDQVLETILRDLRTIPNEDEFINLTLKPLFSALGFEGVTVIHHTGRPERGKDLVFFDRDRLGTLTFYAVVATKNRIHANSSKTRDAGHYAKIIEQVSKCYHFPHKDYNLKGEFFIDKVIVTTPEAISEEAQEALALWEQANRKHLVYLSGPDIAGMLLKLRIETAVRND